MKRGNEICESNWTMENNFLIPFDEGTDVLVQEPSFIEPVRPPSLPPRLEAPAFESTPTLEPLQPSRPRNLVNEFLSRLLGPIVVILTAWVVYRLFL